MDRSRVVRCFTACWVLVLAAALTGACSAGDPIAGLFASRTPTSTWTATHTWTPTPTRTSTATLTPTRTRTTTRTPTPTLTPTPSPTPTETEIPTYTSVPTWTSRPTRTPTITPTPTYDYPDGRVLQQANCRYGPGAAYLFEWGLYPGNRVTIYNRNDRGTWLYVKPNTYRGRCWVSASLVEIQGDIFALDPFYSPLPYSTLYSAPRNAYASRNGNEVWIGWDAVWMTEDDYRGYLVEAWLCVDGEVVFTPIHVDGTVVVVTDEPGCDEPSHGRLFAVEKHGYTDPVPIVWPGHALQSAPPVTRP